jgi:hypothetical protein
MTVNEHDCQLLGRFQLTLEQCVRDGGEKESGFDKSGPGIGSQGLDGKNQVGYKEYKVAS